MVKYGEDYKLFETEIHGTGYPMDGHKAVVSLWAYEPSSYHLHGWAKEDDMLFAKSMYQSEVDEGICAYNNFEEFMEAWEAGTWDPCGVFCFAPDQIKILKEYPCRK